MQTRLSTTPIIMTVIDNPIMKRLMAFHPSQSILCIGHITQRILAILLTHLITS